MSRYLKNVSFGKSDEDIVEYLDTIDDKFSTYVKRLIRQDMTKTSQDSDVKELIKTINKLLDSGSISINKNANDETTATKDENKPPIITKGQMSAISNILNRK